VQTGKIGWSWLRTGGILALWAGLLLTHAPAEARPLRIAAEIYPPFEYQADGKPVGLNVELLAKVFGDLGVEHEILFYPFPRSWKMLQRGGIDAILSVSYHPSREAICFYTDEQRAFPKTYRVPDDFLWLTHYVFFIDRRRRDEVSFEDYAQLKRQRMRIGVVRDYTYDSKLIETDCDFVQYSTPEAGLHALLAGDIDLFPLDRVIGGRLAAAEGIQERIMPLDKVMVAKPYHLLFGKRSDYPEIEALRDKVYTRIRQLRRSGEFGKIAEPYMKNSHMLEALQPIRFVAEEWPPFEYLEDGVPVGIDMDLLASIMPALQTPYVVNLYPWSRAWKMAENGLAEAVLSISYKASREEQLFYTDEQRAFAQSGIFPSDYLWRSEYRFFVKKSRRDKLHFDSYKQLAKAKYRIGVNRDYTYTQAFLDAPLNRKNYPTTEAAFAALLAGEIDLYPIDITVGYSILKQMGLLDSVVSLPNPLLVKPYLMPFCRNSPNPQIENIWGRVNQAIRQSRTDGSYDQIRKRHGLDPEN